MSKLNYLRLEAIKATEKARKLRYGSLPTTIFIDEAEMDGCKPFPLPEVDDLALEQAKLENAELSVALNIGEIGQLKGWMR